MGREIDKVPAKIKNSAIKKTREIELLEKLLDFLFIIQYSKIEMLLKMDVFFNIKHFFRFVQPPMPKQIQKKHFLPIINEFLKVGAGSFESGPPSPKIIGSGRQNFWSRS